MRFAKWQLFIEVANPKVETMYLPRRKLLPTTKPREISSHYSVVSAVATFSKLYCERYRFPNSNPALRRSRFSFSPIGSIMFRYRTGKVVSEHELSLVCMDIDIHSMHWYHPQYVHTYLHWVYMALGNSFN
jgi:hypothetical protein